MFEIFCTTIDEQLFSINQMIRVCYNLKGSLHYNEIKDLTFYEYIEICKATLEIIKEEQKAFNQN